MSADTTLPLPIILASVSRWRRDMLINAGLTIEISPSGVDEDAIKESMPTTAPQENLPLLLAEYKARRVCPQFAHHMVIGADQVLICDGQHFDKPPNRSAARAQLQALRGKSHNLVTAAVIYCDGQRLWHTADTATLTMREFSDPFLDRYLDAECPDIFNTVGGYRLEGPGVQLFSQVKGDYFTILGLPLLKILAFLRQRGDLLT